MSNYRIGLRNMHRETRFSIPINNTSIKRRILIDKLGLSQEIESAVSNGTSTKNYKTGLNKGYTKSKLSISSSNFKNNTTVRPLSPYDKGYNSDIDDNLTLYNESIGNRLGLRSPTPDIDDILPSSSLMSPILHKGNINLMRNVAYHDNEVDNTGDITLYDFNDRNLIDEKSYFFRRANSVNVIRKAKSLDIIHIPADFNSIKDIRDLKTDFEVLKEFKDLDSDESKKNIVEEKKEETKDIILKEDNSNSNSNSKLNSSTSNSKIISSISANDATPDHTHETFKTLSEIEVTDLSNSNTQQISNNNNNNKRINNNDYNLNISIIHEKNEIKENNNNNNNNNNINIPQLYMEPSEDNLFEEEISIIDQDEKDSSINPKLQSSQPLQQKEQLLENHTARKQSSEQSQSLLKKSIDESIKQPSEQPSEQPLEQPLEKSLEQPLEQLLEQTFEQPSKQSLKQKSEQPLERLIEQSINQSIETSTIKQPQSISTEDVVLEENNKEMEPSLSTSSSTSEPSISSTFLEQMLLKFVAYDEQEKALLQQAIINQTTQRLNEQQQEADRLTNKINHQKVKLEERQALHHQLSQELELKRRQSAELRRKLSTQFEKNQKQRKELNYYKEMNTKFMEENRLLQQRIRELTKIKFARLN